MGENNEEMIKNIGKKLNIVNECLINREKFKHTHTNHIKHIHHFLMSKHSFSPSEITPIPHELR
ncbi:DUF1128 family protein, partial [Staphylococcus hominis]|uniref:DUF1128 family protein n=1 Tax=Staphylococcus hominis TaxID=1290 RepID=UPI00119F3CB2